MKTNRVMLADSYKYSHSKQYPANMVSMFDYMESRGGTYPATVFFGLQYYIMQYLVDPIEQWEIDEAREFAKAHGVPFDHEGWEYIVQVLKGKLPVVIKAVNEGTLVPVSNVLMTIESTDTTVPWIAGWLETLLMKVWYPTTIATKSYYVRQTLLKYGNSQWVGFAYHSFSDRGATCPEAAAIGGMAHLTQFMGTDNFNSLRIAKEIYLSEMAGYSVYATEHSSTTSHTKEAEEQFVYDQVLANPDAPILSFVADSYDVFKFVHFCTAPDSRIRKLIESRPHQKFVIRPDSGNPISVISQILNIMTLNDVDTLVNPDGSSKILFKDFGILWGDGITPETIEKILQYFTTNPDNIPCLQIYAAENFIFGSGGDLIQNVTRDTQKFAVKCSSITLSYDDPICKDGQSGTCTETRDVFKDPVTDSEKRSKKGRLMLYKNRYTGSISTDRVNPKSKDIPMLETVYRNGELIHKQSFEAIRALSR